MPRAALIACQTPGCRNTSKSSLCDVCRRARQADRRKRVGTVAEQGYGERWRRVRAAVLTEAPLCAECARAGRVALATDVDHILPRSQGGSDARSNLQSLCHACHSRKTITEGVRGVENLHPRAT